MTNYTLNQIRKSFNASADEVSMIGRYICRPISFYVTFLAFKVGINTPNKATGISLFLGLISMVFFALTSKAFFILGLFLYFGAYILDFVDGNIARVTNSATYYGKFLDGIVDIAIALLLPIAIAMRFYFLNGNELYLFWGVGVAMFMLFACYLTMRASLFNYWIKTDIYEKKIKDLPKKQDNIILCASRTSYLKKLANITTDVRIITLLVAAIIGMRKFLFMVFLASTVVWSLGAIIIIILNASKQLDVCRISKKDSRL